MASRVESSPIPKTRSRTEGTAEPPSAAVDRARPGGRAGREIRDRNEAPPPSAVDRASAATPKTRSRTEGAAVALDELDRRLLNLMQGSFPLEPRPYAAVARAAEIPEEQVLERVRRAAGAADHPPGHPDLRHPRAGLLLDAGGGQGRLPSTRGGRRRSSTPTPGSRTTTCATTTSTCGSRSPPSPIRRSAWRARWRCCSGSPARSRSASCRR